MIKKIIQYEDLDGNIKEETVYFKFSLLGIKHFEILTGKNYYTVYESVSKRFFESLKGIDLQKVNPQNIDEKTINLLAPVLFDANINHFVLDWCQAFYAERQGDKLVQNDLTIENIQFSDWLMKIATPSFFMEIFHECNANAFGMAAPKTGNEQESR